MSKFNGKPVAYAALHSPLFIPGYGQTQNILSAESNGLTRSFVMTIDEPFLHVEVKDKTGKPVSTLVPLTQTTHLVMKPE